MPRTSRKKRNSHKGSRKRRSNRKRSSKTMTNLMTPGKISANYDPLDLLSMGNPNKKMNLLSNNMGMSKMGLINPLVMPFTTPGILQRKVIFTPTGPEISKINMPNSNSQLPGSGLFTPSLGMTPYTLPSNTEKLEGTSIIGGGGDGSEDLDTMSYLYMNNPSGFMSGLRPTGLVSTFLEQDPYYQFAKQYQHKDEAPLVFDKDHGRPSEALNVSAPGHQNAIPDRLAVASSIDLM